MSYPKYKLGDIVRCAGAVCEVVTCKDYTPPVIIGRDCCSVNATCYTYDLKSSSGASFGNIPEDEISPVEEEGKEEVAKIYKFKKDDVVRLKDNHALGIILSRDKGKSGEDFGATNMYTIKFNSRSVIGYYKESDLETAEFKHNVNRTTDLTGMLCYIPKQADTEFVNINFGTKYICIDAFKPDRVLKNLILVSCDGDSSIVESYSAEICPIDEERVDQDIIYKLKKSLMKEKATENIDRAITPEAKYKVGDHVIYTGLHVQNEQYLWHGEKYIIRETLPVFVKSGRKNAYVLDTIDGARVSTWVLEEDLVSFDEEESGVEIDDSGDFKYDIDDHIFFNGHEQVIIRKMHIGLNKYYKIRHVDDGSTHCYIVSEYALDKEPSNQPPKNEFHPTSEMSLYDHLMNTIGKGGYKVPRVKDIDTTKEDDEGSLYREPFILSCTNVYPCDIKVYDLGLGDKMPDDYTMKVMVSQPLSDKKEKEIVKNRNKALLGFTHTTNCEDDSKIVVVDNLQFDRKPTPEEGELNHFDYLSTDIKLMKDIDYIIFAYGWQNSKGCNIEYQMAKTYGIPMYFA